MNSGAPYSAIVGAPYMGTTHGGYVHRNASTGKQEIKKSNFVATVDPTSGDDANDGYDIGSQWINVSTGAIFLCAGAPVGAANWVSMGVNPGEGLPAGINTEVQYRVNSTTFGAVTGSSWNGTTLVLPKTNFSGVVGLADGTAAAPALTFTSDTDTGFYANAANKIGATVGGSAIFTISSATGVTPVSTSVVSLGNAGLSWLTGYIDRLSTVASGNNKIVINMTSAGTYYGAIMVDPLGATTGSWSLGYSASAGSGYGTPVLTWTGDGRVGIGTASPAALLTLDGAINANLFKFGDGGSQQDIAFGVTNDRDINRLDFYLATEYGTGVWTKRLVVTNQGNVGIGTIFPNAKCNIIYTTEQLRLGYDAANYASLTVLAAGGLNINTTSGSGGGTLNIKPADGITYYSTVSVNNLIYVMNYARAGAWVKYSGSTIDFTDNSVMVIRLDATGETVFNDNGSASLDFRIEGDTLPNLFFVDASADSVGINTNSPQALFHVNKPAFYNYKDMIVESYVPSIRLVDNENTGSWAFGTYVDGSIYYIASYDYPDRYASTSGTRLFSMRYDGRFGINNTGFEYGLNISNYYGQCLQLIYDQPGAATIYARFAVSAGGDLTITPSGGDIIIPTNSKLNIGVQDTSGSCLSLVRTTTAAEVCQYISFASTYHGSTGIYNVCYLSHSSGSNYNIDGMFTYVITNMTGTGTCYSAYGHRVSMRHTSANAINNGLISFSSTIQLDANTGAVAYGWGYYSTVSVASGATLTDLRHFHATDTSGAGTLTTQYGLKIENLTKGATNWSIYTGTAPSLFGGVVQLASGSASAPSITFSADTNCGMYLSATDNLAFCTNGTRSFYIDSSQNFQISGDVRPSPTASFDIGLPHASSPQIWRNAYFTGLGVGITAAAPTARAQIVGTSTQLILGYDATTNQATFFVDGGGLLTVAPSGGTVTLSSGASYHYPLTLKTVQTTDDAGQLMTFQGGGSGLTTRGYIGFTHAGTAAATAFGGEVADYMLFRGETGIHLGISTNLYATLASSAITVADGINLAFGTSSGTKIGTATSQKLGFWNATPVVQQTTGASAATFVQNSGNAINDASTFDGYTIAQMAKIIRTLGLAA